ncbi:hypothetical protein DSO57_1021873 [Entomophthora muscae]|uniref:Uncharacterized protein n=1 Tax=Entomophthora muscae TaxID=34485 RepID=A0ACC2TQE1_9FUNG|nr:hypothetical protein DSO57_1021873 [Entomophthora muscae]
MPGTRNKGNLKVDSYNVSQDQYSQSIGSPGSVYDQYFDADSDVRIDGPLNRRLKNQSSLSQVMTYTDLMGSETEEETQVTKAKAVPITSFDSTAGDNSEDDDYDEDCQAGAGSDQEAKVAIKQRGRRRSIAEPATESAPKAKEVPAKSTPKVKEVPAKSAPKAKETPAKSSPKTKEAPTKSKQAALSRTAPAIPQVDGEDEGDETKSVSPSEKSESTKKDEPEDVPNEEKSNEDDKDPKKEDSKDDEEEDDDDGEGIFDYYDILSVEKDCPTEKVVEQYRKEIVMAEFERLTDDGKARIREVAEAYYVLADPNKRAMYDKCLAEEDMSLLPKWKPSSPIDPDALLSDVFSQELLKELFKPEFYFTPMSYVAGAVIGFILLSWPGLVVFAYLGGRVGDWEDNRPPPPANLLRS